jgi:hypothetical protein
MDFTDEEHHFHSCKQQVYQLAIPFVLRNILREYSQNFLLEHNSLKDISHRLNDHDGLYFNFCNEKYVERTRTLAMSKSSIQFEQVFWPN